MMRLPALDPHERAYLQALQPSTPVRVFACRLRQRLLASLGAAVEVGETPCDPMRDQAMHAGSEPAILIEPELAAAWLALRLGGKAGCTGGLIRDDDLTAPFRLLIRRTLAESVVNAGKADWPQAMRLRIAMGGRMGAIDIFWNSANAMAWAHRTIREKA